MAAHLCVLVVTNTFPTDAAPNDTPCVKEQIMALRANGVEVDVFYINRYEGKLSYLKAAWQLFSEILKKKRYDLIHAYYGHSGLLARLQFKYPVVTTFLGSDLLSRKDGLIGKTAAKFVEGVIVMTEEMKRAAKRPDALVIPFGVNTDLFRPIPQEQARRELELPLDEKLVLFPYNPARPEKRFDIVERAVQLLQQKQEAVSLIVVFNKPHDLLPKYMSACDAMILASDREGSPVAVREAIACNLAVVAVDVGDVRQAISDVDGCYLCKRDAADLAEKLSLVLERGARVDGTRAVKKMDVAWSAAQVIQVYEFVLTKTSSRRLEAGRS